MPFTTPFFLAFFPLVYISLQRIPTKLKLPTLLLSSFIFYLWQDPTHFPVILAIIATNLIFAHLIHRHRKHNRPLLILAITANILALGILKYTPLLLGQPNSLFPHIHIPSQLSQFLTPPLGISFFTLIIISYLIAVAHRRIKPTTLSFATLTSFFPTILAGPIHRPHQLLPQLQKPHPITYSRLVQGLQLILWGLFLKLVIADRLAFYYANPIFQDSSAYAGGVILLGIYAYSLQIYADFAGYTHLVTGLAALLGIDLISNFRQPYFASSISDFWRRWHISLSTWLRDYIYIPLGGNHTTHLKWIRNILLTFLASGLWHGVGLTFIAWGLLHGITIILEKAFASLKTRFHLKIPPTPLLRTLFTFHLVSLFWVFFRSDSLRLAAIMISRLFRVNIFPFHAHPLTNTTNLLLVFAFLASEFWFISHPLSHRLARLPRLLRWTLYLTLAFSIINLSTPANQQFIYTTF